MWIALLILAVSTAFSEILYVASAASLRPVISEILESFTRSNPGVRVKVVFGSSGSLYAKIKGGAPYHVFLSADTVYPKKLIEEGLAVKESYLEYAEGRLVVVYNGIRLRALDDLESANRIAVPNPRFAPYGKASVQALRRSGLFERVKDRIVYGSDVSQTAQFISTGTADTGFLSMSLALYMSVNFIPVPEHLYDPVIHALVITARGKGVRSAWEFVRFMKGEEAKSILKKHGFGVR
ncbi:MAG: molybdate ABC transporter substrate-binding protein [Aquificota bacterium]|nr:molybdate ABC transporter substrate-binding protein [Aquificota bacterium]